MTEHGIKIVTTDAGVVTSSVTLGRDSFRRPFRRTWWKPWRRKFQCQCCGAFTLDLVDMCDICGRCGWEDWYECHDSPAQVTRPNYLSLIEARTVVKRFGCGAACQANRARGVRVSDLESMSAAALARLKTLEDEA